MPNISLLATDDDGAGEAASAPGPTNLSSAQDEDGGMRIGDIYIPPPPLPACTFDATGPRLIIHDIVIENFKSYGGKVTLGPFQKNFSAIVGPNGSGKSNVIDSMLFVFGYRSQKIRCKTVGVLVHNSDKYPNLNSCHVSVHFKKIIDKSNTEYDDIEGSEFIVSRSAFKDNSSFYSIDGRRVQFKEVSRLLRSHGIDLDHNRFLILQGEVEQISLMKPKAQTEHDTGMLEFLEEIIGSGRFKEPTEQLARKVEELNEQRCEKLNRVKAVEKEKDNLEGAKEEALDYIRTKNKITLKHNILYQCRIHAEKVGIEDAQAKKKEIEDNMKGLFDRAKEIEQQFNEKKAESAQLKTNLTKTQKEVEKYEAKFAEYDKLDTRCRQDLKNDSSRAKELSTMLTKDKTKLEELVKSPDKLASENEELKKKRVKLVDDKSKAEKTFDAVMAGIHSETQSLREQKDKYEAELMKLQKGFNEAKSKMDIAQVELDLYLKNEQDEKNKLFTLQDTYKTLQNSLKESEMALQNLKKELPDLEKTVNNTRRELNVVTAEEIQIQEQLRIQRIKMEEAKMSMRTLQNRGRLLEALMQEKTSGRIPGIIGRLGDLGAIDEKYDVAISTACGPLDNIVTDTLDTAQECIKLMKRQNLGQATFIALDKMQVWKSKVGQKINTPQNIPRLFDLIKVKDGNILPAFYFALRDTLVADNIHQATEIGMRGSTRHRVVTLKGELIETSGTMSGGGMRQSKGRMGTSVKADAVSPLEVQNMEAQVNILQGNLVDLRKRKAHLEELIGQYEQSLEECRYSVQKHKLDLQALTRDEPVMKGCLKKQEERTAAAVPDKTKVKKLTNHLENSRDEFQKVENTSSVISSKVQSVNDEINEISGGRVKEAQNKLDDVNKKIDTIDNAVMKNEVAIKTVHRNIAKKEESIKEAEKERVTVTANIAHLKEELRKFEVVAEEVTDQAKAKKLEVKEIEEKAAILREEVKRINTLKVELDNQKLDVNHKFDEFDNQIKERVVSMKALEKKLSALTLERIDHEGELPPTLPKLSVEELEATDCKTVQFKCTGYENKLKGLNANLSAIAEFRRKEALYLQRVNDLDAITRNRDAQRLHHENLRKQRLNEFMEGFQIISHKLKETYQMLTLGGDAELELVNSLDPFSDGIVFSVRPPRKSWKNISNLSGGEKTLSSLALVFTLHYYKPTPFYVMDEIDAALDFRNVTIVGHYIKEQTKNAQFIVISLRNHLFELADRLVGVYKTHNASHSVAIDTDIGHT